jgi:hypothetical protein
MTGAHKHADCYVVKVMSEFTGTPQTESEFKWNMNWDFQLAILNRKVFFRKGAQLTGRSASSSEGATTLRNPHINRNWATVDKITEEMERSIRKILSRSIGLSPFLEATYSLTTQEIPCILWSPKFHYRVQKNPPLVPIMGQINPVHTTSLYLFKIHFNNILPRLVFSILSFSY